MSKLRYAPCGLRTLFSQELDNFLRSVDLQRSDFVSSCLTCRNWDHQTELCKKFNARPPAHVIVNSCNHYDDIDEVPF